MKPFKVSTLQNWVLHHCGPQLPQKGATHSQWRYQQTVAREKHECKLNMREPGQRAKNNCRVQDVIKLEQQLMSRTVVLHWFPTLHPDIAVKLVLGIGGLKPPGKAMRIVAELDMRRKGPIA